MTTSVLYKRLRLAHPTHTHEQLLEAETFISGKEWVRGMPDGSLAVVDPVAESKLAGGLLKPLSPALERAARLYAAEASLPEQRNAAWFQIQAAANPDLVREPEEAQPAKLNIFGGSTTEIDPELQHRAAQPIRDSSGRWQPDVAAARGALLLAGLEDDSNG